MTLIDTQLDSTERELGRRLTSVGLGHYVRLRRPFEVSIGAVWQAITDPDRLAVWLGQVTGDLRLGGSYQLDGNAHGDILACHEPDHLSLIWDFAGPTELEIRLAPATEGGTLLELEHTAVVPEEYLAGVGQFAANWELVLYLLDEYLHDTLPAGALEWAAGRSLSPDVERLLASSVERWSAIVQR